MWPQTEVAVPVGTPSAFGVRTPFDGNVQPEASKEVSPSTRSTTMSLEPHEPLTTRALEISPSPNWSDEKIA